MYLMYTMSMLLLKKNAKQEHFSFFRPTHLFVFFCFYFAHFVVSSHQYLLLWIKSAHLLCSSCPYSVVECSDPDDPDNGLHSPSALRHTYKDQVVFSCKNGFAMEGAENISACKADGAWSLPTPKCTGWLEKMKCGETAMATLLNKYRNL